MTAFTNLPTEILIEIFMYLDYFQLNSIVRPVCRRFNDVLSATSGPLAVKLFCAKDTVDNDKSQNSPTKDDLTYKDSIKNHPVDQKFCFQLHPIISHLIIDTSDFELRLEFDPRYNIGIRHSKSGKFTPLYSTRAYRESAMSPGVPADKFASTNPEPTLPFIVCDKNTTDNITFSEFVDSFITVLNWHLCPTLRKVCIGDDCQRYVDFSQLYAFHPGFGFMVTLGENLYRAVKTEMVSKSAGNLVEGRNKKKEVKIYDGDLCFTYTMDRYELGDQRSWDMSASSRGRVVKLVCRKI